MPKDVYVRIRSYVTPPHNPSYLLSQFAPLEVQTNAL